MLKVCLSVSADSWSVSGHDAPSKQAILRFVAAASKEGGSNYVPPAERIAAFDNDGTPWVAQPSPAQPAPAQTGLLIGKLGDAVKADPSLAAEEPYQDT